MVIIRTSVARSMQNVGHWKMLLSHHPPCEQFKNHTFGLFSLQFCIGCFIGYPSMIFAIVLSYFFATYSVLRADILFFLGLGMLSFQLLSLSPITEIKILKIFQKAFIGFGAGLILHSAYLLINASIIVKIFLLMAISVGGYIPLQVLHMKKSKEVCNQCKDKWNSALCPTDMCFADAPDKINK
ncbi:hypothetical protein [Candidatus Lokiarchaeum ossiferum]|uniref:hypothetical protein n=1 Tax=Candidatus Lokiarchaeum ossiferum TaxID=2951803 RepID=UPI00352EEB59